MSNLPYQAGEVVGAAIGYLIDWLIIRPVVFILGAILKPFGIVTRDFLRRSTLKREDEETRTLYEDAKAAYLTSSFAEIDPYEPLTEIFQKAFDRSDEPVPSLPIRLPLVDAIKSLMIDEGFWGMLEIEWERERDMEEAVLLRNYFRTQKRLYSDPDHFWEIWSEKLVYVVMGLLGYLPEHEGEEEEGDRLRAPLVDLVSDPAEMIQRLIVTFFDDDLVEATLFEDLRKRLDANALVASGIDPTESHRTTRQIILPTSMRKKTPTDLVEMYLGGTAFEPLFLTEMAFRIPPETRFEHCHIVGGTGHGKTQLLQQIIHEDLLAVRDGKASLVVIDSQGDLIRKIAHLAYFSPTADKSLADRFMLIDPNDIEFPVALNMFDVNMERMNSYSAVEREKILNGTIELYEYIFGALLGAELTQKQGVIFRYLARLMLSIPGATVQTLRELMEDGRPFKPYMEQLEGTTRKFFETQFFDRSFGATKSQILKRLWGVLSNTTFERMFSNPTNKVDIFEAMNSGKVILINTAKDLLKQEGCEIFGRFFIAMITQAAMQRAAIPEEERTPTYVIIDECQDYLDEHAEALFNQARKYKVALHVAHQNLDQLSRSLEASIMASTSIKLAGGMSAKDAQAFSREMRCEVEFLQSMKKRRRHSEFACWIKNTTPQPIRLSVPIGFLEGLPRLEDNEYDELIAENRKRYCVSREELEAAAAALRPAPSPPPKAEPSEPEEVGEAPKGEVAEVDTDAELAAPAEPTPKARSKEPVPPTKKVSPREWKQRVVPDGVPPPMGRGGKEHKYLQAFIKQAGEDRGFRSVIEQEVAGGAGRVDVSLTQGDTKIAVEISITSTPDQELKNIQKCLEAGYDSVIAVCPKPKQLGALRKAIEPRLSEEHRDRVKFLTPDAVLDHLDEIAAKAMTTEETIRGYKVRVRQKPISPEEAKARRDAIAKVIARSVNRLGEEK